MNRDMNENFFTKQNHRVDHQRTHYENVQHTHRNFSKFVFVIDFVFVYNADLLKICEKLNFKTNVIKFVNDVKILTYNINIEKNCKTFENLHKKYEK